MIGPLVYILGAATSLACGALLWRGYSRGKSRLLFWSSLCFFGLTVSNVLLFMDLELYPETNMYRARLATAAVSLLFLVYGLIWERE